MEQYQESEKRKFRGGDTWSMSVAIYCRVSSLEQASGVSLDSQRIRCEEFARLKGWSAARIYQDIESGTRSDRPELMRLRANLARYDAIVFWRLDRATRSLADFCTLVEECKASDTAFVSVSEGFDTGTITGEAMASMLAVFAQMESDVIGERTRAIKKRQLEKGVVPWRAKYGYVRAEDGSFAVCKEEAAVIQRIYHQRAKGYTQREIAAFLARDNITKRGVSWPRDAISYILRDETYKGILLTGQLRKVGRKWHKQSRSAWTKQEGIIPRIVSDREWDAAQNHALLGRKPNSPGLFRGLVKCMNCESALYLRVRQTGKRDYICDGRRHGKNGCMMKQIGEMLVWQIFEDYTQSNFQPWIEPPDKEAATDKLQEASAVHQRMKAAYREGLCSLAELKKSLEEAKRAKAALRQSKTTRATERDKEVALRKIGRAMNRAREGDIQGANQVLRSALRAIHLNTETEEIEVVLKNV